LSISDSIILIDRYDNELETFIEDYAKVQEENKLLKQIEWIDIISNCNLVGKTKEQNNSFNNWKRNKVNEYNNLIEEKHLTLFQKLRRGTGNIKQDTVFTKLKRLENGI